MVCAPVRRDNPQALALSHLYLISSVELVYYGLSRTKDWVSVDCDTKLP